MEIKVLGPGCAKCEQTYKIISETVAELGVEADIKKITGVMEIAAEGIMGTPGVIIDGKVKIVGKVPDKGQVVSWLQS